MMFQFSEGMAVALKADDPGIDLDAGATGIVWASYKSVPPSYEVTFKGKDGEAFDVTMSEDDLVAVPAVREFAQAAR